MISYFPLMHIGSSEGITLLEFNKEEEKQQEAPQPVTPKGEEQALEDLPECLDHRPTSFIKGKPRSFLSLSCFCNTSGVFSTKNCHVIICIAKHLVIVKTWVCIH